MLLRHPARADARALVGAALVGSALGIVLGGSYMAGGAARAAVSHARVARLAAAASRGYSEAALQSEADAMGPGALAVARRHDPFDSVIAPAPDRPALFTIGLDQPTAQVPAALGAGLIKANLVTHAPAVQPAPPLRMSDANPLAGARELDCLAAAVYYEARGEGRAGQAAVAQVVLNRMRHPAFPHSVCGVVFQGAQNHACQFSFVCDGAMRRGKEPAAWRNARDVAARALGGYVMATVGSATNFHAANVTPGWSMSRIAQIGSHVFYAFGGHAGRAGFRAAPGVYVPARESEHQPELILASAVVEKPQALGMGGPAGPAQEPASAPAVRAEAEAKPAAAPAPAEIKPTAEKGKAS